MVPWLQGKAVQDQEDGVRGIQHVSASKTSPAEPGHRRQQPEDDELDVLHYRASATPPAIPSGESSGLASTASGNRI